MKRFRPLIVVVLLIGAWLAAERFFYRRTVPPTKVTDINSFLQWRRPTRDPVVVQGPGGEHLLVMGPGGGVLPSGPSAYVFDCRGHLIEWSSDIGDDNGFQQKWQPSKPVRQLTPSEIPAWFQRGVGSNGSSHGTDDEGADFLLQHELGK
jgi:hypothetical protein